ncbi:tRNA-splicing endonuclease subunit sen54 N-term-domain-containing protein [Xylaria arbuscula]|nr:tRNA-splicing endonuclease subunit sen54 N-term-domain-containing protein [Xylaria arbuscula]
MPFDDEDVAPTPLTSAGDDGLFDAEDGDQAQDFRLFTSLLAGPGKKSQASGKAIRRGEKDFESHGTRAQESVLESSRSAMHEVLSYTRQHQPRNALRGWYFPDRWADMPSEGGAAAEVQPGSRGAKARDTARGLFARERVVALESDKSTMLTSMGRVVTTAEKLSPGRLKTWLLPEEALFLIERGTLDLWWPVRGIEDILPADEEPESDSEGPQENSKKLEDYERGIPLSLQAAYALFIGPDGERGKITLEKYQVYANLRRIGYRVLRATPLPPSPQTGEPLWRWLFSLLQNTSNLITLPSSYPEYGPLVRPGLYRSYVPIFEKLALIQRHKPTPLAASEVPQPQDPFKIHFYIWKSSSSFMKTRPPPPDFQMEVADARDSSIPTLEQLDTLLLSTPWDPPEGKEGKHGAGFVYRRLKHGWRNAIVAIVDRGLISYMRFSEMAFGEELLYKNTTTRPKAKRGGRAGRGRGGGRGRGRGRGG